jgi:hypothetical protein
MLNIALLPTVIIGQVHQRSQTGLSTIQYSYTQANVEDVMNNAVDDSCGNGNVEFM